MKSPLTTLAFICIVSLFKFGTTNTAQAANYQATVIKLKPTYYYELNETDTESGVMDTMGNAPKPGTYNGDYGFGGAGDSSILTLNFAVLPPSDVLPETFVMS